jgi:hypothetical protein
MYSGLVACRLQQLCDQTAPTAVQDEQQVQPDNCLQRLPYSCVLNYMTTRHDALSCASCCIACPQHPGVL